MCVLYVSFGSKVSCHESCGVVYFKLQIALIIPQCLEWTECKLFVWI